MRSTGFDLAPQDSVKIKLLALRKFWEEKLHVPGGPLPDLYRETQAGFDWCREGCHVAMF